MEGANPSAKEGTQLRIAKSHDFVSEDRGSRSVPCQRGPPPRRPCRGRVDFAITSFTRKSSSRGKSACPFAFLWAIRPGEKIPGTGDHAIGGARRVSFPTDDHTDLLWQEPELRTSPLTVPWSPRLAGGRSREGRRKPALRYHGTQEPARDVTSCAEFIPGTEKDLCPGKKSEHTFSRGNEEYRFCAKSPNPSGRTHEGRPISVRELFGTSLCSRDDR